MFIDYHVHTAYSDDSSYPMERVVQDAIAHGIEELAFTDHVDYGVKRDWDDPRGIEFFTTASETHPRANIDHPRYVEEISKLQARYGDKITLKMGAEFGMQTHTISDFENLFARYPYDFILLSIHQIQDLEFWTQTFQASRSQEAYNRAYYQEMLDVIQAYHDFSALAHLDLIKRYDNAGIYPDDLVEDLITQILEHVITCGKGIEVNTSSFRYGLKDLMPSRHILRLYRKLGGEILTIGSDSHKPEHLGAHIPEVTEELKSLGFNYLCTFTAMKPSFHRI